VIRVNFTEIDMGEKNVVETNQPDSFSDVSN
jgi:hypothetical protein